ncbi:hypothetical protein DL93DRAFT_2170585 [Clavulina sp. PMI_390]|nr:hypothetical protein DL93DRAFT_2170585 [Clavulina sp. PMI_390]
MSASERDVVVANSNGLMVTVRRDPQPGERSALFEIDADREFIVPLHFHPAGGEWMKVLSGQVEYTLDGKKTMLTPEMGEFHIPPGLRHSILKRKGVAAAFQERSEPDAKGKSVFFEDLFASGDLPGFIDVLAICWRNGDTYVAVDNYSPDFIWKLLVWVGGGFVGNFLGFAAGAGKRQ